jgi:hypothetical protein
MSHTIVRPVRPRSAFARVRHRIGLWFAALAVLAAFPSAAGAADLNATPANLASVFAAAQGGDVIHLAAGSYGTFNGGSKPSTVTLTPAPGAAVSMGVAFSPADHIALDGMTITAANLVGAHDISITNSTFTGLTTIDAKLPNANILLSGDRFDGINTCSSCLEGRVSVRGYENSTQPVGVTIANSHFGNGGESDGIQIVGGAYGVQVGPGNEFSGIKQGNFSAHVDPIQLYGSSHTLITGNYFHDNSTAIMAGDGGNAERVENNVFVMDEYPWAVVASHIPNMVLRHNTVLGGSLHVDDAINPGSSSTPSSGTIVDNAGPVSFGQRGSVTESYNIFPGASGQKDISANPKFVGGAKPTTYAGFVLAPGTPGTKAADDGADMGIVPAPPPTPVAVPAAPTPTAPAVGSAPKVGFSAPRAGARFTSRLRLVATAADDHGINRVGFWVDRQWVGTDRKDRYAMTWRAPKGTRFRSHTVTARAFSADGQVSSVAITVRRVHTARAARAGARGGWRLTTRPIAAGTAVRGRGVARHRIVAYLTRCDDNAAHVAQKIRMRAGRDGTVRANVRRRNLCVLKLKAA